MTCPCPRRWPCLILFGYADLRTSSDAAHGVWRQGAEDRYPLVGFIATLAASAVASAALASIVAAPDPGDGHGVLAEQGDSEAGSEAVTDARSEASDAGQGIIGMRERVALVHGELEVLRPIARGLSNQEIAAELVLAEQTVKTHVSRILTKNRPARPGSSGGCRPTASGCGASGRSCAVLSAQSAQSTRSPFSPARRPTGPTAARSPRAGSTG